jgi:hypothetical protein
MKLVAAICTTPPIGGWGDQVSKSDTNAGASWRAAIESFRTIHTVRMSDET